jgi:hypothetical protein
VPADGTRAAIGGSGDVFGKLTDKAILAWVYNVVVPEAKNKEAGSYLPA